MKKRLKFIVPLAVLSVGCAVLAACGVNYTFPDYSYRNPDFSGKPLEKDEGIVLDGKAEEAFWRSEDRNWLEVKKATDEDVSLRTTSYIGEKGLYMLFDVNDPAVYVNPDRATYNNSGVELYLSADKNATNNAYEIDLNPDGRTRVSLQSAKGRTVPWYEQFEFGVSMKGGDYNTGDCTGYVIEAFFPNRMFGGEKKDLFYSDVAVISTVNEMSEDREWYPFAQKEYGGTWMKPESWFTFDTNGFMGAKSVKLSGTSEHVTLKSFSSAVENFSYTAKFEAEEGYAITGLTVNGKEVDPDKLTDTEAGVDYRVHSVCGDVEFEATAAPITAGNKTLSGSVCLYGGGKDTPTGDAQISLKNQAGASVPVTLGSDGSFTLSDLPQGLYTFTVSQANYKTLVQNVAVNRDRTVKLRLSAPSIFETDAHWDLAEEIAGVVTLRYGEGNVLNMAKEQGDFVFGYTVKPSGAALQKSGDLRYGIRASFVSGEEAFKDKYLEYDLLYNSNSKKWLIQMPNHDNGSIFANEGYKDVYSLSDLQVDKLLKDGLQIQLVRQGATFYLYVNGVKVVTKTVEGVNGADTVKVVPGFLHYGYPKAVDFAFDYSTDYNAATWDAVTVEEASGIQHGSISFDKQSYAAGDDVVVTAIPADGYILTDILVNGYSYATEITDDNQLTFKVDAKTIAVEPVFVEATATVDCKVVNFPNAEGLQVRLTKNGEVLSGSEKTVVNGKTEFTQIAVGRYGIQIKAFGVWGNTDKILTVNGRGTAATIQIDNAAVYTSGNLTTQQRVQAVSVDGLSIGDGWFAAKVSNLTDIDGDIRFGFRIDYGDANDRDYTILKEKGSWKFQVVNDWASTSLHRDFSNWLTKKTSFYFAVQRIKESGTLNVYMGTGLDNLVKVGSINGNHAGKNIVCFGLKRWEGAFDVTFSDVKYGATAQEAFGCANGASITVNNNAPESEKATNHGAITVSGSQLGSAVTLGIQADTSDSAKHYICTSVKVNGVERLQDFAQNQLTISELYLKETLEIEATFEEAQKYRYAGTAQYFAKNAWHDFTDATLVFTDSSSVATEAPVGANGEFSADLYTGSYTVTVKDSDRYILQTTQITVGTAAQTGVELKAAYRVFALKGCDNKDTVYSYEETIAQNTFVTETVNGKSVTFDGSLPLNKKNGGALIDDAEMSEIAKGNFSMGIYIKIPSEYNVSGEQRMVAPGIRFESGKTFFIFFMSTSATAAKLQTFPGMYNNVATDWREAKLTDAEMSKAKSTGIYVRLVRIEKSYYWMVDDRVIRVDEFTETPKEFMFVRWDQTLEKFAYKVEACEELQGNIYQNGNVALGNIAQNQDFEASVLVQIPEVSKGDYRIGFVLNFGGKDWHFGITRKDDTQAKLQLTEWSYWGDRSAFSNTDIFTESGAVFKMKRTTTDGTTKLKFYLGDTLIYTYGTNADDASKINSDISSAFTLKVEVDNKGSNPYDGENVVQYRDFSLRLL